MHVDVEGMVGADHNKGPQVKLGVVQQHRALNAQLRNKVSVGIFCTTEDTVHVITEENALRS